jgi:D-threo-aldose 1-dehydrogenase
MNIEAKKELHMKRTAIGTTGLSIPAICFGTSALGNMPATYGYAVDDARAHETIRAIFDSGMGFLDTSRNYGLGRSETRIGAAVRERGGLPRGFVISSKIDRNMDSNVFDGAQARRSLEESLKALAVDHIPLLHLHDPEYASDLKDVTKPGGAIAELIKMKEEGLVTAIGLAAGKVDIMMPLLREFPFDALISHNRFTLLNRHGQDMFAFAKSKGMTVINAAPYASGILAKGPTAAPLYAYQKAPDEIIERAKAIAALCAQHGVPLGAAALQFSMRSDLVDSTICGASKPESVAQTLQWAQFVIPPGLWTALAELAFDTTDPEATRVYNPA